MLAPPLPFLTIAGRALPPRPLDRGHAPIGLRRPSFGRPSQECKAQRNKENTAQHDEPPFWQRTLSASFIAADLEACGSALARRYVLTPLIGTIPLPPVADGRVRSDPSSLRIDRGIYLALDLTHAAFTEVAANGEIS
jgi:hypothetical protein